MTPQDKLAQADAVARLFVHQFISLKAAKALADVAQSRGLYVRLRERDQRLVIGPAAQAEDNPLAHAVMANAYAKGALWGATTLWKNPA